MPQHSKHVASLNGQSPRFSGPLGSITHVDAGVLPLLKRLSIRRLLLEQGGLREPHWHANAHELGYVVRGEALVTIAGNHSSRSSFVVRAGDMFFAPSGALHAIQNLGAEEAEFILAFSSERVEDFGLSASFGAMTPAVLGNTFDAPTAAFEGFAALASHPVEPDIVALPGVTAIELQARHVDVLKFGIEAAEAQIAGPAGTAKQSKRALWAALEDIAMYSVRISEVGMREPHWHPQTAELGYVVDGSARMTILDPDGSKDTYELNAGDVYFIPPAYPHHIENLGPGTTHFLIFFDRTEPGDIGFRTLVGQFPRAVLAASFGMAEPELPHLPFTETDPLLVTRRNPIDPRA